MHPRPFTLLALAAPFLAAALGSDLAAQTIRLTDGRVVTSEQLAFDEGGFVVRRNEGDAVIERRTAYAEVGRMEWPEPEEIARARTLLDGGKPEEAASLAELVMRRFEPTRSVAGSPWQSAATVRLAALARLGRDIEVAAVMRRMESAAPDKTVVAEARLAMAEASFRKRAFGETRKQLDDVLPTASGTIAARAWLLAGDLALEQSSFEEALRAYLRLPVFFHRIPEFQARAALGAARAYRGLGDNARAGASYDLILSKYPATDEARIATVEKASLTTP